MVWSYACHFYFLLLLSIMAAMPPSFNFSYFLSKERFVRLTKNFKKWNHQKVCVDLMFWNALRHYTKKGSHAPPPPTPFTKNKLKWSFQYLFNNLVFFRRPTPILPPSPSFYSPTHRPISNRFWIRFCKPVMTTAV